MAKWFYVVQGQAFGPIDPATLRHLVESGRIKPDDKVRRDDVQKWYRAGNVKGLFVTSETAPPSSHLSDQAAIPYQLPQTSAQSGHDRRLKWLAVGLGMAILAVAVVTSMLLWTSGTDVTQASAPTPSASVLVSHDGVNGGTNEQSGGSSSIDPQLETKTNADAEVESLPKVITDDNIRSWALKYGWLGALDPHDFPTDADRQRHFTFLVMGAKGDLEGISTGSSLLTWEEYFQGMRDFLDDQRVQNEKVRRKQGEGLLRQLDRMQRNQSQFNW